MRKDTCWHLHTRNGLLRLTTLRRYDSNVLFTNRKTSTPSAETRAPTLQLLCHTAMNVLSTAWLLMIGLPILTCALPCCVVNPLGYAAAWAVWMGMLLLALCTPIVPVT